MWQSDHLTVNEIIRKFGSFIRSLTVGSEHDAAADAILFNTIIRNCSPELKSLKLYGMNIRVNDPNFRLPYPELVKLELNDCTGNLNLAHSTDGSPNLTKISLMQCRLPGAPGMVNRQFENLVKLTLMDCNFGADVEAIEQCIRLNPRIRTMTIGSIEMPSTRAFQSIGQHMLNLTELYFTSPIVDLHEYNRDVRYIDRLSILKTFGVNCNGLPVSPVVDALAFGNIPIQSLYIGNGRINDIAVISMSQIRTIEYLEMGALYGLNEAHLIKLSKKLPQLNALVLYNVDNDTSTFGHYLKMEPIRFFTCVRRRTSNYHPPVHIQDSVKRRLDFPSI